MSRHTNQKLSGPDLFQLNVEKLENLLLLDNDHMQNQTTIVNLPLNIDVIKALNKYLLTVPNKSSNSNTVNELYVLI